MRRIPCYMFVVVFPASISYALLCDWFQSCVRMCRASPLVPHICLIPCFIPSARVWDRWRVASTLQVVTWPQWIDMPYAKYIYDDAVWCCALPCEMWARSFYQWRINKESHVYIYIYIYLSYVCVYIYIYIYIYIERERDRYTYYCYQYYYYYY